MELNSSSLKGNLVSYRNNIEFPYLRKKKQQYEFSGLNSIGIFYQSNVAVKEDQFFYHCFADDFPYQSETVIINATGMVTIFHDIR